MRLTATGQKMLEEEFRTYSDVPSNDWQIFRPEWINCDDVTWGQKSNGYTRENDMNISADFEGKIKRIGNQFLLKLGCNEFICQTLSDVGKKITTVLTEEYKRRDDPETETEGEG